MQIPGGGERKYEIHVPLLHSTNVHALKAQLPQHEKGRWDKPAFALSSSAYKI